VRLLEKYTKEVFEGGMETLTITEYVNSDDKARVEIDVENVSGISAWGRLLIVETEDFYIVLRGVDLKEFRKKLNRALKR